MKRIFRSILNIRKNGTPTIPIDELVRNYKQFVSSRVNPEDPSYIKLYHWIEAHYRSYHEVPSIELLYERATGEGEGVILDNLKEIATQTPYVRSDYKSILQEKFDEQNSEEYRGMLNKVWQAASTGLKVTPKKEIKGIAESIEYFSSQARKFRFKANALKTESQIISKEDSAEVRAEYEKRKRNPGANIGLFSYLNGMDDTFRGTKLGDLMIIAAFVAQGKTTFAANLAYNGILQGLNGYYAAMEMNFNEMRDFIYCLHTCNPQWFTHPKYKHLAGKISYEKICYGELSKEEHEFFEVASEDLGTRSDFGELIMFQPPGILTPSILETDLYDRQTELSERKKDLDFAIIDYVGLMGQDKDVRYGDFNADLNSIIKHLKNMAINFNNGRGLRMITPFQTNRDGWKEAVKEGGIYKLTALSNANEAERASDQIISLYMSEEMKRSGLMKICCLKHRRGAIFSPFDVKINFTSRKIESIMEKPEDTKESDKILLNLQDDIPVEIMS
jgi:hypothetical protein